MDERPGRRVERLVADGERRTAPEDDVELLDAVLLEVALDDMAADGGRCPAVDAERPEADAAAHGQQNRCIVRRTRKPVEVVDRENLVAGVAHRLRSSSSTTGSSCSTPSTRSSRFSVP